MADRKRAWAEKKARLAEAQAERELMLLGDNESKVKDQANAVAMGGGEEQIFEKKLSKEEKKAESARKREEKRKAKLKAAGLEDTEGGVTEEVVDDEMKRANKVLENVISAKNNGGEDDVTRES